MIRNNIGLTLLIISISISLGVIGLILYVHFDLLINGKGIGSFSIPFYIIYDGFATFLWLVSFIIYPKTKLHFLFWFINIITALLLWISPIVFSL